MTYHVFVLHPSKGAHGYSVSLPEDCPYQPKKMAETIAYEASWNSGGVAEGSDLRIRVTWVEETQIHHVEP